MSRVTINVEGGLLPDDLLEKIADGFAPGQHGADFGVTSGRLTDEIMRAFSDAQSYWSAFNHRYDRASKGGRESITTVTRDGFVTPLLAALGYNLEFKRARWPSGDQSFNISHTAGDDPSAPPVNIVSADDSLDDRGSARRSAHSAVQEYLNVSDSVWGIVTNGRKLRLIRNSSRIAKPRYIEFDLAGMMGSNVYSDFHLFYRLLHRSRLPRLEADASECWLSKYYDEGVEQGSRVRDRLRDGVLEALKIFGNAFLTHPASDYLRQQIAANQLSATAYYRELLRLVYRLLFLMVAEERRLMFPDVRDKQERRAIFTDNYGLNRLRARVEVYVGDDPEIDLWESLKQTFRILRDDRAARMLGMAALNGELFGPHGCPHLDGGGDADRAAFCRNDELLRALDSLSKFNDDGVPRRVNFGALDVEELGSVYESLLEYHPQISAQVSGAPPNVTITQLADSPARLRVAPPNFDLAWGSERKSTGSYYTPPDLVRELINSALVPVMEDRLKRAKSKDESERAILAMRVIDPAAGSGHFLLAAARRMGRELAKLRTEEEEPAPSAYRHAVRDVIRECIYAVDKNQLAVDLCKVALWIEGHNAGQPLSFLDHHVKCGDSLVGVFDLKVLEDGIPDDAYKAAEGDDKAAAKHYRALNRETKKNHPTTPQFKLPEKVTAALEALSHRDERTPEDVAMKEREYAALVNSPAMQNLEHACNTWTAAFFVPLRMPEFRGRDLVPTSGTVWERLSGRQIYPLLDAEIAKARFAYSFFHWPVEFPDVFARGGFDVVLGNPPWERIKLQEKEFFASRDPEIVRAANKAAREKLIKELPKRKPELAAEWAVAVHGAEAQSKFVRASERFLLCGRGDVNTYSIFAELARGLAGKAGRAGIIVPSGIATDDTTKFFFRDLMESHSLASLYDFENRKKLFPAVDSRMKFCLLTMARASTGKSAEFVFFTLGVDDLRDTERRISLSAEDIALLNPNTRTCPIFRTRRDAEITKAIYRRVPVLVKEGPPEENPWGVKFATMFHMSNDSHLFRTREQLERDGWKLDGNIFVKGHGRYLPLYEAKLFHQFDHRFATYAESAGEAQAVHDIADSEKVDLSTVVLPRYWVSGEHVEERVDNSRIETDRQTDR
ncbi:MAG: Eco57I restriction-modification methylase domain-containing protein, partial [Candidatus Binataceae bacterium]